MIRVPNAHVPRQRGKNRSEIVAAVRRAEMKGLLPG